MYYFMLYNTQSRITCIWSWNYTHFQFNIYYNSILCFYIFIPCGSVYTMGDRFVYSPESVLPVFSVRWIDLLVPRTALGGNRIP